MLKVNHINVYYGKIHALKDVSFEVQDGEVVALIGANGAGKSTTLKTVSGMQRTRTGSIEFLGENITHTESHKLVYKGLAHVPEGRRIFLQMTVLENLEMGAYIHKNPTKAHLRPVPPAAGAEEPDRRYPLRRRAADAGHGPRPDQPSQAADAGRALHGSGPHPGGADFRYHRRAPQDRHPYVLESGAIKLSGTGKELAASDAIKKAYLGG